MEKKEILAKYDNDLEIRCGIYELPDVCPLCNNGIEPSFCYAYYTPTILQIIFRCPRERCQQLFIGNYFVYSSNNCHLRDLAPIYFKERDFSVEIMTVSQSFIKIYNEALQAEKMGLTQISGPGYGKALEFLIKDYAISREMDDSKHDEIKKKFLSKVIKDHVRDENIRTTAELATWLRNDETHYIRIWTNMDINDLKVLIELTVRWIESEEMTRSYKARMSSPTTE